MHIVKLLINILMFLFVAIVLLLAFHRTFQYKNKVSAISNGLWAHHPEIMREETTGDYFPGGMLKDMTVTAQIDREILLLSAILLVVLYISNVSLELYMYRSKRRREEEKKRVGAF